MVEKEVMSIQKFDKRTRLLLMDIAEAPDSKFAFYVNAASIEKQPIFDAPGQANGVYPDNFSTGADFADVLAQLLEMSPGLILSQSLYALSGTIAIRFRTKKGKYHNVGFIDINKARAALWHPKFFPNGKEIKSRL